LDDCAGTEGGGMVAWDKPTPSNRPRGKARGTANPVRQAAIEAKKLRRFTSVISCNPLRRAPCHHPTCKAASIQTALQFFSEPFMAHFVDVQLTCVVSEEQLGISPNEPLPNPADLTSDKDLTEENESAHRWCRGLAGSRLVLLRLRHS